MTIYVQTTTSKKNLNVCGCHQLFGTPKTKLLCTKIINAAPHRVPQGVQQASVEVLEGQENTFSAWLSLSYMNKNRLAIWQPAEVEELIEYTGSSGGTLKNA